MGSQKTITKFLVLAIFIVVSMTVLAALPSKSRNGSTPTTQEKTRKSGERKVIREPAGGDVFNVASEAVDPEERALRQAKNRRYNRVDQSTPLTELPEDVGGVGVHGGPPPPPLPVKESDFVVIGTVIKAQPYFSETRTSIYSEFSINIEEVLKNDVHPLDVGAVIIADREGGALRLSSGRIVRFNVGTLGRLPRIGRRYVFFLKRIHEGQDITILTAYKLHKGRVFPLTMGAPYEDFDEQTFLNEVRTTIAHPPQGSSSRGGGGVQ